MQLVWPARAAVSPRSSPLTTSHEMSLEGNSEEKRLFLQATISKIRRWELNRLRQEC